MTKLSKIDFDISIKSTETPVYPSDLVSQGIIKDTTEVETPYSFFKNNGLTEVTELRESLSRCGQYATNNDIIVRVTWDIPALIMSDNKALRNELQPTEKIIVGVSKNITNFKIGDKVNASSDVFIPITIDGNNMNIENVISVFKAGHMKDSKNDFKSKSDMDAQYSARKYKAYDYFVGPSIIIHSIISENNL